MRRRNEPRIRAVGAITELNVAITAFREKQGLVPIDDGLPDRRTPRSA